MNKLIILTYFSFLLFGQPQEFTIFVKTQNPIKPITLSFSKDDSISLESYHLIKSVIEFDLLNCGYCEATKEQTPQVMHLHFSIGKNQINLKLNHLNSQKTLPFTIEAPSTKTLHSFTDDLVLELFGTKGIASDRILFTIKEPNYFGSEIFIKHFDLEPPIQITQDRHYKMTPIFIPRYDNSPSDDYLFVSYISGPPKIFKGNIHSKNQELYINLRGSQFLPSLSPHGDFLSFISDTTGNVDLFVQRLDHNSKPKDKPMQIFSNSNGVQASSSFDPKNLNLAFVSDFEKKPKIYQLDLLKTLKVRKKPDLEMLSPSGLEATCPSFSPDGTKLAYSSPIDGVRQIFIFDIENGIHYPITEGAHHKENPSWASNNLHLCYNTTGTENELYVINLNQKKPIKITQGVGLKHYPCWERLKKRKIKDST